MSHTLLHRDAANDWLHPSAEAIFGDAMHWTANGRRALLRRFYFVSHGVGTGSMAFGGGAQPSALRTLH